MLTDRGQLPAASDALRTRLGLDVSPSEERAGGLSVTAPEGSATLIAVVRLLDELNVTIADIGLRRPTLDDVFLRLTGQSTEADEEAA